MKKNAIQMSVVDRANRAEKQQAYRGSLERAVRRYGRRKHTDRCPIQAP